MWKPPDQFFEAQPVKNDWGTSFAKSSSDWDVGRNDVVSYRKPDISVAIDPLVQQPSATPQPLLDKETFAARLLAIADEAIERNGQRHFVHEAKDRHAFLKLYAETMGFVGQKALIDASTNFTNNEMKVILVKPDKKQETEIIKPVIEHNEEITNITPLRIKAV